MTALAVLLAALIGSTAGAACTKSWSNPAGGFWSEPGNWNPSGVPSSSDDVCITEVLAGAYAVGLSGSWQVNTLTIGGSGGSQTLSITGGTALGGMLTAANGITNSGTISLVSAGCSGDSTLSVTNGILTNTATGVINLNNCGLATVAADLVNNGTISVANNGPDAAFTKSNGVYTNNGNFVVQQNSHFAINGLNQSFTQNGGTLTLSNNTTFNLTAATFNLNAGAVSGSGTLSLQDSALGFGVGSTGTGTLYARGTSTLSGDVPAGVTVIVKESQGSGGTTTLTAANGFSNFGTVTLDSPGCSANSTLAVTSGTLTNAAGAAINVNNCGTGTIAANLTNNGTISINTADARFTKADAVHTNNANLVIQQNSHLTMNGSHQTFNQSGGALTLSGNTIFSLTDGTLSLSAGTVSGSGVFDLRDAALNFGAGATIAATIFTRGNSTLSGDVPAGVTLFVRESQTGATASLTAANGLRNFGAITLNPPDCFSPSTLAVTSGTLRNTAAGVINFFNCATATIAANVINNGQMNIDASAGDAHLIAVNGVHTNNGGLKVDQPLTIEGSTFSSPGTITGDGPLRIRGATFLAAGTVPARVENFGEVSVGGASIAILNISYPYGGYLQDSSGVLRVQIGGYTAGTQFDQVNILGDRPSSLGGTLDLSTIGGFSPNVGDSFTVMTFRPQFPGPPYTGNFDAVNGTDLGGGKVFTVNYTSTAVSLAVVLGTPIPSRTPTNTVTRTPTITPTRRPTRTPTISPTNTRRPTRTPTTPPTLTATVTPTITSTATRTKRPTKTPTVTPTSTNTRRPSKTPTESPTPTPTP